MTLADTLADTNSGLLGHSEAAPRKNQRPQCEAAARISSGTVDEFIKSGPKGFMGGWILNLCSSVTGTSPGSTFEFVFFRNGGPT